MGKIYVITQGEYSNYSICAATTNKAIAEAYLQIYAHLDNIQINEFEDLQDQSLISKAKTAPNFFDVMITPDGEVSSVPGQITPGEDIPIVLFRFIDSSNRFNIRVATCSQSLAEEIAVSYRDKFLAELEMV